MLRKLQMVVIVLSSIKKTAVDSTIEARTGCTSPEWEQPAWLLIVKEKILGNCSFYQHALAMDVIPIICLDGAETIIW